MTNGFAVLARWSARQKLSRVSSVQLRRSARAFNNYCVCAAARQL